MTYRGTLLSLAGLSWRPRLCLGAGCWTRVVDSCIQGAIPASGIRTRRRAGSREGGGKSWAPSNRLPHLRARRSVSSFVADHPRDRDDVAGPAAGCAPRVVDAAVPLPVLHGDPRLGVQLRGAAWAVLRQVLHVLPAIGVPPPLPGEPLFLGQDGTSAQLAGISPATAASSPRAAAAFTCSFLSRSACGEYREEPRSIHWRANSAPDPNFDRSQGRSIRSRWSRITPSGSLPCWTAAMFSRNIRRSMVTPMSDLPMCSAVRSAIGPWVTQVMTSCPSM